MKIKNTSAIPLRAAYLHGPYTLHTACYPSDFDPNVKHDTPAGSPQFEPNLKAGGSWCAQLKVPDKIRETGAKANVRRTVDGHVPSFTWIIDIASQVIFSASAAVHFELLVGRDEKSVELGFDWYGGSSPQPTPGQLQDHQQGRRSKKGHSAAQPKGVYSKAVNLVVDDTASLWNKPSLEERADENDDPLSPTGDHLDTKKDTDHKTKEPGPTAPDQIDYKAASSRSRRLRKVHLVILTHGLHSNVGADLLYLKESIDAAAKQARIDARKRKLHRRSPEAKSSENHSTYPDGSAEHRHIRFYSDVGGGRPSTASEEREDDSDEEEVIVRGFSGNVVRTERGIQYLGKRLAKYVLSITYPDQPHLPVKKSVSRKLSKAFTGHDPPDTHDEVLHHGHNQPLPIPPEHDYQITSISFIGHSLGGLTQTYAIAYIHKHSPTFFEKITPINFVALATPFLGLSNENPIYVKLALSTGLVGRTGQDLGLTWRPPTMVRSGWEAMIGGIGHDRHRAPKQADPGAKPLLRVLPTGPAHHVLSMFKNRTIYSNVVNDGIVPLRTSCLLFLDWRGLGRVEKARRENGLIGTMVGWGWAEMTGANSSSPRLHHKSADDGGSPQGDDSADEDTNAHVHLGDGDVVPQPSENATKDDTIGDTNAEPSRQLLNPEHERIHGSNHPKTDSSVNSSHPFTSLLSLLRPSSTSKSNARPPRRSRIYSRSQTIKSDLTGSVEQSSEQTDENTQSDRPSLARGGSVFDEESGNLITPPKTSVFESAGDILNPPLPTEEFIVDPTSRPRTIFHDRVYHPEDIPPPPQMRRRPSLLRPLSTDGKKNVGPEMKLEQNNTHNTDSSGMKVEEKIARAYHRHLSWRKVLVRLEPDAHNNIVVRRMFANAYGWPVIKHLVDTHFADTWSAAKPDSEEDNKEHAKPMDEGVGEDGAETNSSPANERGESADVLEELRSPTESMSSNQTLKPKISREDSAQWDDLFFEVTDDDDDDFESIRFRHYAHPPSEDLKKASTRPSMGDPLSPPLPAKPSPNLPPRLTKDPEALSHVTTSSSNTIPFHITPPRPAEPVPTINTTGLGLGKSLEERMPILSKPHRSPTSDDTQD